MTPGNPRRVCLLAGSAFGQTNVWVFASFLQSFMISKLDGWMDDGLAGSPLPVGWMSSCETTMRALLMVTDSNGSRCFHLTTKSRVVLGCHVIWQFRKSPAQTQPTRSPKRWPLHNINHKRKANDTNSMQWQ